MNVNKHVLLLVTHPSFDMGFDRAVNDSNYWSDNAYLDNIKLTLRADPLLLP